MFKIESYVTPILLSYVDKYVRDFKPGDAQVSLWDGGVSLHNLVLKTEVLQEAIPPPFTLVSGRIHELLISVPWTKIISEPIVVTIETIECVVGHNAPEQQERAPESNQSRTAVVEAPPGYMQALVRRIVSNISLKVHHLIVKYVQDDIVLSLNVKHLSVDSTGPDWVPTFADIDQTIPIVRRLLKLDNLTLCLDQCDIDGKIRYYQEPLLYRCQVDIRVLTRLVSANVRRASHLSIQILCPKLAWGLSSDQLLLIMRMLNERQVPHSKNTVLTRVHQAANLQIQSSATFVPEIQPSINTTLAEPVPSQSQGWAEWAWSWLPSSSASTSNPEETPVHSGPTPLQLSVYCERLTLSLKIMELECSNRKRPRSVLEFESEHLAVKSFVLKPTKLKATIGMRSVTIKSLGKCVCGHYDWNAAVNQPTVYLSPKEEASSANAKWEWPMKEFEKMPFENPEIISDDFTNTTPAKTARSKEGQETPADGQDDPNRSKTDNEVFWELLDPIISVEFSHDRAPPNPSINPHENTPEDFEYSDWIEEFLLTLNLRKPLVFRICTGMLHRINALTAVIKDNKNPKEKNPPPGPTRTLTVEECEALMENLPQRRINVVVSDLSVHFFPWDHSLTEKPEKSPVVVEINIKNSSLITIAPLYSYRVCSAVCQIPVAPDILKQETRLRITLMLPTIEFNIFSLKKQKSKPCGRADLQVVINILLHQELFSHPETMTLSFTTRIKEANICGSSARFLSIYNILLSLFSGKYLPILKMTTLTRDAIKDEKAVVLDVTIEDSFGRGFITRNTITHVFKMHTMRITALHALKNGGANQAWILAAPDVPSSTPYFRSAFQWCKEEKPNTVDYLGIWTEPGAMCLDPLLVAWLAYSPHVKENYESRPNIPSTKTISSTLYLSRRSYIPTSSSGRGGSRSGSGVELVHSRARSTESGSSDFKKLNSESPTNKKQFLPAETLLKLHERLRHMVVTVEFGLAVLYITMTTATAVHCSTLRSAMEQHAAMHKVLAISLGRWYIHSNVLTKQLWEIIRYDRPTFLKIKQPDTSAKENQQPEEILKPEAFPWKLKFADVSFYTLDIRASPEYSGSLKTLRSRLKAHIVSTRTILELVTTTVTVSFVTKKLKFTQYIKQKPKTGTTITSASTPEDFQYNYFSSGTNFKPSTLKEFIRGPENVKGRGKPEKKEKEEEEKPQQYQEFTSKTQEGPVISIGVNMYAETQPITIKLELEQLSLIAGTIHCFQHVANLIKVSPFIVSFDIASTSVRSLYELDESIESEESSRSELVPIFQANKEREEPPDLTKFLYFQWVVNKVTIISTLEEDKFVLQVEDVMCSIDMQTLYNQAKIKMTSAFIKTYQKTENEDWEPGVLGGRVLETRGDGTNQDELLFLSVTITQARISDLPYSWKEELHPKLLESQKARKDSMWEIFATMAPLEVLLQLKVIENLCLIVHEIMPETHCVMKRGFKGRPSGQWQWPYFYLILGGLRAIVHGDIPVENADDTVILSMVKTSITPLPDNPICRRALNSTESTIEGFQYELKVKSLTLQTTHYQRLMEYEASRTKEEETGQENPATKWTSQYVAPELTSIIRPVNISAVFAPPHYIGTVLTGGPALEINLLSDCVIELSIEQIQLLMFMASTARLYKNLQKSSTVLESSSSMEDLTLKGICLYKDLLAEADASPSDSDSSDKEEDATNLLQSSNQMNSSNLLKSKEYDSGTFRYRDYSEDSGVDTTSSQVFSRLKTRLENRNVLKKSVQYDSSLTSQEPMQQFELFVTTGVIDITIEANDDESPYINVLRPPNYERRASTSSNLAAAARDANRLKLFNAILHQPNMYFWMNKTQKCLQFSLFDLSLGLGGSPKQGSEWHSDLLTTATGQPDKDTDIRPALATFKLTLPVEGSSKSSLPGGRGLFNLDIERPVMFHVDTDKITRIRIAKEFIDHKFHKKKGKYVNAPSVPILLTLKNELMKSQIDNVTVKTSQMGVMGTEGVAGWDSATLQVAVNTRPDRLLMRSLVTAAVISMGGPNEDRRVVMLPLYIGSELDCIWESWCKAIQRSAYPEAVISLHIEADHMVFDISPDDIAVAIKLKMAFDEAMKKKIGKKLHYDQSATNMSTPKVSETVSRTTSLGNVLSFSASLPRLTFAEPLGEHYYQDDLRSGAFKIIRSAAMPMPYQVTVYGTAVTWAYPHPRTITKLVAYPLPGQNEEIECVLELFNTMQLIWEPHTFFSIPVLEEREIQIYVPPPEAAFATRWRYRLYDTTTEKKTRHMFKCEHFLPCDDPFAVEYESEDTECKQFPVSAEEISGVLRIDSYFAPHLMPGLNLNVLLNRLQIAAYNSILPLCEALHDVEGYYVSKPLMRSHRFLTMIIEQGTIYGEIGSPTGTLLLFKSQLSSDLLNCKEQVMEEFIDKFDVQAGISILPEPRKVTRTRFHASTIRMGFNLQRLKTLKAVANHWIRGIDKALSLQDGYKEVEKDPQICSLEELEGWVAHWIHNTSAESLRVGQVGTDEDMPLPSGVKLAYNWRNPHAERKLRFALNSPSTEWRWSDGVDFKTRYRRVKLTHVSELPSDEPTVIELHVKNETLGSMKYMVVAGRLVFANLLRFPLNYKIRVSNSKYWKNSKALAAGELPAETVVHSYLCEMEAEVIMKIKFATHNTSWSGDIPLKECPKRHIPWLVKVPSEGDIPYISVWCRVTQATVTDCIFVTFWPLYMLHSHLTQDTDVMVVSQHHMTPPPEKEGHKDRPSSESKSTPLLQGALGRGAITHLLAPGTTTAKHSLTFQYRNLDCPVTREAVEFHYGMSDVSVFQTIPEFTYIAPIVESVRAWIKRAKGVVENPWPYSIVTKHYQGVWVPALLQPRCDINVNYEPINVGGGCSLMLVISPVVLLCNASPIVLTLRAHDAAPLCKVEPGNVISPSSIIVTKPFFVSVEVTRETFVSQQLELYKANPGQYTELPPGQVAVDHPTTFAIQCNNKVAFLTLYYEVKHDINVFGISSTFWIKNNLRKDVLVSAMTTVDFPGKERTLIAKGFTLIEPTDRNSMKSVALCKFRLRDRWHGTDETELNAYICLSVTSNSDSMEPDSAVVPIRLIKTAPTRTALTLFEQDQSIPVVVTQQKHEGRWMIIVSLDPCPQYVVHNGTNHRIALGEPECVNDYGIIVTNVSVVPDCYGIRWTFIVKPKSVTHYTTPSYSARHPSSDDKKEVQPRLTFSSVEREDEVTWCSPVVVEDGEQLLQLPPDDFAVKLTICSHPHSTLIDIQAVQQTDIAASDVRQRITRASQPQVSGVIPSKISGHSDATTETTLTKMDVMSGSGLVPSRLLAEEELLQAKTQTKILDSFMLLDDSMTIHDIEEAPNATKYKLETTPVSPTTVAENNDEATTSKESYYKCGLETCDENKCREYKCEALNASKDKLETTLVSPTTVAKDNVKATTSKEFYYECGLETCDENKCREYKCELIPCDEEASLIDINPMKLAQHPAKTNDETTNPDDLVVIQSWHSVEDASYTIRKSFLVTDLLRGLFESIIVEVADESNKKPLFAAYFDRVAFLVSLQETRKDLTVSLADVQIDNLHYDEGAYDFAVVATTRSTPFTQNRCPALWNMFHPQEAFEIKEETARVLLRATYDTWDVAGYHFKQLTEVSVRAGPVALYLEDLFIKTLVDFYKMAVPQKISCDEAVALSEANALRSPLVLRLLNIDPIDLTLTIHTAVRMYIALDHSPLHLGPFKREHIMMSPERLAHNLTVHYLSAVILGAGWVVGGLELLGAPGAFAARLGGATGGVREFATTAAAAMIRSLSALARSLARNLDLLSGDEEHAMRAAAARRRPPDSFISGLITGLANFAVNILGAVGGLAHHPLVGVAVGESTSGTTALRRSVVGALAKPLSATADLFAYAGHGLLNQAGWDLVPQPRAEWTPREGLSASWRRDCVRWTFRLAELCISYGVSALYNNTPVQLLLTHKYLVVVESDTENIIEMVDLRLCHLKPCQGNIVELEVQSPNKQMRSVGIAGAPREEEEANLMTAAALSRLARYTGAEEESERRVLQLLPTTGYAHALHAALTFAIHSNLKTHFVFQ